MERFFCVGKENFLVLNFYCSLVNLSAVAKVAVNVSSYFFCMRSQCTTSLYLRQ